MKPCPAGHRGDWRITPLLSIRFGQVLWPGRPEAPSFRAADFRPTIGGSKSAATISRASIQDPSFLFPVPLGRHTAIRNRRNPGAGLTCSFCLLYEQKEQKKGDWRGVLRLVPRTLPTSSGYWLMKRSAAALRTRLIRQSRPGERGRDQAVTGSGAVSLEVAADSAPAAVSRSALAVASTRMPGPIVVASVTETR